MTLRELDGDELLSLPSDLDWEADAADRSPLTLWYAEIKDTDIEELSAYDLDQLLIQRIHRLFIIPVALEKFIENPVQNGIELANLLETLSRVSIDEWQNSPSSAALLRSHMPQILRVTDTVENEAWSPFAAKLKSNLDIVSHLV